MAEESDDKSEEPTGRKLDQARDEGQVAQSQEIKIWAGLMGALVVAGMIAPGMATGLREQLLPFIEHPHDFDMDPGALGRTLTALLIQVLELTALPLVMLMAFGLISAVSQNGILFVPKHLLPKFDKINPVAGLGRIFSVRNLVEFIKSLLKVGAIGLVLYWAIKRHMNEFVSLAAVDIMAVLAYLQAEVVHLIIIVILMVTAMAAADWFYQRWAFTQKMRMTKQEVKDEHKQTEGDPMIKSRLRGLRMQRARQRMMTAVPKADVVVTNPTHFAVALKYDMETMSAPVLVAKGADLIAKRIRELADEHEVPIVENPPLARALFSTVEIDQEVPPEHYKAVAEVIGYVMKLKGRLAQ